MVAVVREQLESRSTRRSLGSFTGTRRFFVYDDGTGTPITQPEQVHALYGTATTPDAMPNFNHTFPNISFLEAKYDRELKKVDGHSALWTLDWDYELIPGMMPPGPPDPNDVGYTEVGGQIRRTFHDTWRIEPGLTFPPNGDVNPDATADIGGKSIDSQASPGRELRLRFALQLAQNVAIPIPVFTYAKFSGKRNSTAFMGFGPGTLVYEGADPQRISIGVFRVQHSFIYDEWWHLEQIPRRDIDGIIPCYPSTGKAENVLWHQPFWREKQNFNNLILPIS